MDPCGTVYLNSIFVYIFNPTLSGLVTSTVANGVPYLVQSSTISNVFRYLTINEGSECAYIVSNGFSAWLVCHCRSDFSSPSNFPKLKICTIFWGGWVKTKEVIHQGQSEREIHLVSFKRKLRKVSGRVLKDSNPFLGPMLTTRGCLQNPYLAPLLPCRSNTEHRSGEKAGFKGPERCLRGQRWCCHT